MSDCQTVYMVGQQVRWSAVSCDTLTKTDCHTVTLSHCGFMREGVIVAVALRVVVDVICRLLGILQCPVSSLTGNKIYVELTII